jgi:riboflavin kinase/FMN adenylyltransferase
MIISRNINDFKGSKPVLTIGFFDGVHLGHAKILDTLIQTARKLDRKSLVITFWPHPRIVLGNDAEKLKLLTSIQEKQQLIEGKGVDGLLIIEFTPEIAKISGHDFLQTYLIDNLNVSAVVLGHNHAFGHKGQGNINLLKQHQDNGNYHAIQVEPISINGINISSSKIRTAIETGSVSIANAMLGRPYSLTGTIEGGQQLGRSIGYPTANIKIVENLKQIPGEGVYAVWVDFKGILYPAMLNIGTRPTVGNGLKQTIEAHIIGFDQNIYDQQITVQFIEKIRSELRFPTLDKLKDQLAMDKDTVVKILSV